MKLLKTCYYAAMVLAVAAIYAGWKMMQAGIYVDPMEQAGVVMSYCLILYTIVAIAGGLALHHLRCKKLKAMPNGEEKDRAYRNISLLRLALIGTALVAGIVLFYVMRSQSMMYCAGMSAIALVFCKPSELKKMQETEQPQE